MIKYRKGDILSEQADAVVNTVNCVGIMGRGIALRFKKAYPDNFKEYEKACKKELVNPGSMFIYSCRSFLQPRYIINFPTKRHWKGKSQIKDIKSGLEALSKDIIRLNIKSIAVPPLGCGLGGLNWSEVKPLIEQYLGDIEGLDVFVFEPSDFGIECDKINYSKEAVKLTPGRAVLIGLIKRYMNGLLDPFISLLEIHKLIYFLQEAGQPLKLRYKKALYGPYAENLRHVLNTLNGCYISGYNAEDDPKTNIALVPGAVNDAKELIRADKNIMNDFNRVSELIDGFETSFGLELLATVHWVVKKENNNLIEDVIKAVYEWNQKKHKFSDKQINIAYERLTQKRWFDCSGDKWN